MTKTLKVPQGPMFRDMQIEPGQSDQDLSMSISSDVPYLRYDFWNDEAYYEVLDHGPGGMDDSRLKAGLPLLFNHDRDAHLGRATNFVNDGHKCVVSGIVWSQSAFAQEKKADALNGSLPDTSVGYTIADEGECIGAQDGIPIYKFKFTPYEGSLVTVPADSSVGVGRSRSMPELGTPREISIQRNHNPNQNNMTTEPTEQEKAEVARLAKEAADLAQKQAEEAAKIEGEKAVMAERSRISEIIKYVSTFNVSHMKQTVVELSEKAISEGTSFDNFKHSVIDSWRNPAPINNAGTAPAETMSRKDFDTLSPLAQREFCKAGGTLKD
jgi:phage head maturation protease